MVKNPNTPIPNPYMCNFTLMILFFKKNFWTKPSITHHPSPLSLSLGLPYSVSLTCPGLITRTLLHLSPRVESCWVDPYLIHTQFPQPIRDKSSGNSTGDGLSGEPAPDTNKHNNNRWEGEGGGSNNRITWRFNHRCHLSKHRLQRGASHPLQ